MLHTYINDTTKVLCLRYYKIKYDNTGEAITTNIESNMKISNKQNGIYNVYNEAELTMLLGKMKILIDDKERNFYTMQY